ncbi:hypothetical protein ACIPUD_19925 [Bradyrhizobium sp. CAR08]
MVKIAAINGSDADIVWIGRDGEIEVRTVWAGELVSFEDAMSQQSNWGAAAEEETKIRAWRAAD